MNNFLINRFRSLSLAEIPYRVRQIIMRKIEEKSIPSQGTACNIHYRLREILNPDLQNLPISFENISVFGKKFNYRDKIHWHRDLFSGKSFETVYAKKINIRKDSSLSAKVVWEPNRLQFLSQIAINFKKSNEGAELQKFISIIQSWKKDNPYLLGINWYSNIEVNLRLITWFVCWEILDADSLMVNNRSFNEFVNKEWLPLIHQHCTYSYRNPSKYSSANNHLVAEYAGLFIASLKWNFDQSPNWITYAQKGLENEIKKQHSKNGVNREEAAEYIQFITDFFLLAYIAGENSGYSFSKEYKTRLHQIFNYIFAILDINGHFPKYGDEDDGKCFIIDFDENFNNFKSLLTSGAILFNDPVLKSKSNGFDLKNAVLFGLKGKQIFETIRDIPIEERSKFYIEEGHFISKKHEEGREIYIHFDAAPLGFLSIAAHGHADALSFMIHVDGQPVFVDPGTYTYHTESEWRNYFIGTLAHNTVCINRENQATIAGSTLWLNHYKCNIINVVESKGKDVVKASHNGYKKMGITHTRQITFDKVSDQIIIIDWITSKNKKGFLIEIPFHLHPLIKINGNDDNSFTLLNPNGRNIHLRTDPKLETTIIKGQTEPKIMGWYSGSFLKKEPSNLILNSMRVTGDIELKTTITIKKYEH